MNKIEFIKDKIPFTQVANSVLTDKRLSAKAKGLYAYLYSKPDGWNFAIDRISLEMADGRRSINEGLHELEQLGFLTRKRQPDGRVVYLVHFPPIEPYVQNEHMGSEPNVQNSKVLKQQSAKMSTVSNKDIIIIKNISNKELAKDEPLHKEIAQIIKSFEVINPACKSFYGNKTQRKACESLINEYGYDRVLYEIKKTLEITNQKEYLPNIQTPVQLFQKWSSLENGIKKIKNKSVTEQQKKGNVYW